jgi:hypothetical protein
MARSDRMTERYAWMAWAAMFAAAIAVILHDSSRSVVPVYRIAAGWWLKGMRLYELSGIGGFTYLPQAAILFTPLAVLPPAAGEVLWRLVSIAVFALSLRGFARLAERPQDPAFFPLMTLVSIPLVWDCARNGQATLIMTGFMLLAVSDIARRRWWRATLWLALAVAIKPLAIVLVLLVLVIDRPMTWRAATGMIVLGLSPFLTQRAAYVIEQYRACFQNMTISAHVGAVAHGWTSPFTALRVVGLDVPEGVQTAVRLAAAAATLALCFVARRRFDASRSAVFVYSLAALYLILFSPRTENNTYAMLAPSISAFLAAAFLAEKSVRGGATLAGIALALVASRSIERLVAPHAEQIWLSPLLASCFMLYLIVRLFTDSADPGRPRGACCSGGSCTPAGHSG